MTPGLNHELPENELPCSSGDLQDARWNKAFIVYREVDSGFLLKCRSAMQSSNKTDDQILGCLLGGALGDAWGGPWEGRVGPSHFKVPSQSKASDDTQLTLATCESIIERGCVDPESLASHLP
jgi:hypothetical protein